ncbi:hypothetical protein ASPVEDRAFT_177948 [Aspergillus versicolor CBS 583.65]|uniref:Carrier domain-containing protein n=1 Tax=Aspergillus versicolor CBS 583.65 TaxID=1036611 RepID=A0A1L9Q0W8_ASPVE|nr:uncharacterized protein ASPVEDRAFT_177948 [Aspergillus versicolor CBS 583.65]OJJ07366.1 hypothetical protein ASPVEDRAFT_177948 [Aspergillus versicolor CBS 583.65]
MAVSTSQVPTDVLSLVHGQLDDRLQVGKDVPSILEQVQDAWASVLGIDPGKIRADDSFVSLGGNLISALRCVEKCAALGIRVTVGDIFQSQTIAGLIENHAPHESRLQGDLTKCVRLSPIQELFLTANPVEYGQYNQTVVLRLNQPMTPEDILAAANSLVKRHAMLRARFTMSPDGEWTQMVTEETTQSFRCQHHQIASAVEIQDINACSSRSLNIHDGPLWIVSLMDESNGTGQYLSLIVHQLVVDAGSWSVILADLKRLLESGTSPQGSSKPFLTWVSEQAQYAEANLLQRKALPASHISEAEQVNEYECSGIPNTVDDSNLYSFTLDKSITNSLLGDANNPLNTEPSEIIQGCILYAFTQVFTDRPAPTIYVEGHGREPWTDTIDLGSTVGWFTTISPTYIETAPDEALTGLIMRTRGSRRQLPANGWAYFTSRMLKQDGRKAFDARRPFEILFRYTDITNLSYGTDSPFSVKSVHIPGATSGGMQRLSLVEVNALAGSNGLVVDIRINKHMENQQRLQQWVGICENTIKDAVVELNVLCLKHKLSDYAVREERLRYLVENLLHGAASIEDIYPCTPSQRGILLSQLRDPQQYYNRYTVEVLPANGRPAVDPWQLARAWKRVVARHAALRTILVTVNNDDILDQLVLKDYAPEVPIILEAGMTDFAQGRKQDYSNRADDLRPTTKATIYVEPNGRVILDMTISHMFVDATSLQVLMRDLTLAYGGNLDLANRPLFKDFVLEIGEQSDKDQYWKRYLEGVKPCHILSNNTLLAAPLPSTHAKMQYIRMEQFLETRELKAFCARHGLLLTNILHVAWGLVIRCYTAMDNICFSYTTSGRERAVPGIKDCVGLFVNVLIRRLTFDDEQPVLDVLQSTQKSFLESLAHQDCSFANIQHSANLVGQSIFDSSLSIHYHEAAEKKAVNPAIILRRLDADGITEYPIVLNIAVDQEDVELILSYWNTAMTRDFATTIAQTYHQVIMEILQGQCRVGEIDILPPVSRNQIAKWNQNVPQEFMGCVHDLVDAHVVQTPQATAVCSWDGCMTYKELDNMSTRLAADLVIHGVGPGVFVPVCLEKSKWVPVAVLAVLKAGGAFLLLDLSVPQYRLREMCLSLEVSLVIVSGKSTALAPVLAPDWIVLSETYLGGDQDRCNTKVTNADISPQSPAFVLFTSGSTGKPKAIVTEHRASCSQLADHGRIFRLGPASRVLQFSSHSFDVACIDILSSLCTGACLCIPSEEARLNRLSEVAASFGVTYMCTTPSVARLLDQAMIPTLKTIVLAGEPACRNDIVTWGSRLIIGYGPAEGGIATVRSPVSLDQEITNIGKAIPGARTWIVNGDNHNQLLPPGAAGELLIEGPVLFRGYHNDPEKTQCNLISSPAWSSLFDIPAHHRFYKTGDIVHYADDGSLVFQGRRDDQVKLRGQRIELQEVQHYVKQSFADVDEAVADIIKPHGDVQQEALICFVLPLDAEKRRVASQNHPQMPFLPPSETFRTEARAAVAKLQELVPQFMVPAIFLPLAYLPVTSSGKVDRKAIRKKAQGLTILDMEPYSVAQLTRRGPSGQVEETLHAVASSLLNQPPDSLGVDDDLFRRGLDSISLIRYVGLLKREGLQLSVSDVFNHPRISDLALLVKDVEPQSKGDSDGPRKGMIRFRALQGMAHSLKGPLRFEIPFDMATVVDILPTTGFQREYLRGSHQAYFAIHLSGHPNLVRLQAALRAVLESHSSLRTSFVSVNDTIIQVVQHPFDFSVREIAAKDQDCKLDVHQVCREDVAVPVPCGRQYFQPFLIRETKDHSTLVLRLSHAQYDGWSIPLLMRDISRCYCDDQLVPPPTFSDFMATRESLLNSPSTYETWASILRGSSMTFIPTSGLSESPNSDDQDAIIERQCTVSMRDSPAATVAILHKAAWCLVLARWADTRDLVFGQVVSGRNLPMDGIEELVGPCVNMIPVRIKLEDAWTVQDLLDTLLQQHIQSLEIEAVDLEDIVERSTAWPKGTCFGSVVQHQNIPGLDGPPFSLGELSGRLAIHAFNYLPAYPVIYSEPTGDDQLTLRITANSRLMDAETVSALLKDFKDILIRLPSSLDQIITALE